MDKQLANYFFGEVSKIFAFVVTEHSFAAPQLEVNDRIDFAFVTFMGKNLAINMGSCHHRRFIPKLLRLIRNGSVDPAAILTHHEPLAGAIEAYKAFDRREPGWVKVELEPALAGHP